MKKTIECENCYRPLGPNDDVILCRLDGEDMVICLDCARVEGVPIPETRAYLCGVSG